MQFQLMTAYSKRLISKTLDFVALMGEKTTFKLVFPMSSIIFGQVSNIVIHFHTNIY